MLIVVCGVLQLAMINDSSKAYFEQSSFLDKSLKTIGFDSQKYIPKKYKISHHAICDINSDSLNDVIVICIDTIENHLDRFNLPNTDMIPQRPVMVFYGKADGSFELMGRNDFVAFTIDDEFCRFCGIEGIAVKDNYFTIENFYGDGVVSNTRMYYTFKVINNKLLFHRFDETVWGDENYTKTIRAKEIGYPTFEDYRPGSN